MVAEAEAEAPVEHERHGRCTEVDGVRTRLYLLHWHDLDFPQTAQVLLCGPADADLGALEAACAADHGGELPASPQAFASWLTERRTGFYALPDDQWDTYGVGL